MAAVALVAGPRRPTACHKDTALGLIVYLAVLAVNVVPMCGLAWMDYLARPRRTSGASRR